MFTPSEGKTYPGRRFLQVAVLFLGLGLTAAVSALAAPQSPTAPPASAEERASLRQTLESRYEVLPVRDGIALKPRQPRAGIRTIEVTADGVAVNGEKVSARTLRDWLGGDADSILRLQGLGSAEQRQIFGLEGGSAPAAPPAPEATSEEESVTTDATTDETEVAEETAQPETPEPAEPAERQANRYGSGSRVNVGGSVTVDKDEVTQEAVAVGGSATIEGEVEGDVTAIGGPARINGKVAGEVVSVGSGVWLGSRSEVGGDVTSVGGRIHREPGAKVHGTIHEVGFLPFGRGVHFGNHWDSWPWGGVSDVMSSLMCTVLLGLLVCLVLLVARVPLERVDRQLVAQPWKSAAVGLAGVVFFWPMLAAVTVLLAITVIGCALFLLYPFLFLYLGLLALLGYAAVAYRLGRIIEARFNRSFGSPYVAAIVGVLLIQVWSVLGNMLDLLPGPFGFLVGLFGFLVIAVAWIVGIGAVILARFGLAPGYWPQRGAPVQSAPISQAPSPVSYDQPIEPLPLSGMEPQPPADWTEPER